jgi:cell division septation protein DedD
MPETPDHAPTDPSAATSLDQSTESHLETLHRAAIGPINVDYYLPILSRFEAYGRASPSWNWAACVNTLNWMVFRGMWMPALLYVAAVVVAALGVRSAIALAEPMTVSLQWSLWAALATLALLIPGFFGNAWLHGVYRKRLEKALTATPNLKDASMLLARRSSSRPRLVAIVVANLVLASLIVAWFWPSDMHMRMWPRVSGDVQDMTPSPSAATSAAVTESESGSPPQPTPETEPAASTQAQPGPAAPPSSATAAEPLAPASLPTAASSATASTGPAASLSIAPQTVASAPQPAIGTSDAQPQTEQSTDPLSQPLGPSARTAAAQNAAIAAHARAARSRPAPVPAVAKPQPLEEPKAQARAPVAKPSKVAPSNGRYLINVGLFAQDDNARRAHARLEEAGLPAMSDTLQTRNGERTRVRVGPFATQAQADAAAEQVRALQLDAIVVRR